LRGFAEKLAYYRKLGPTKEWAENNYYHLPIEQQNADLVTINAFWRDFAAWDGKAPFLSAHVARPTAISRDDARACGSRSAIRRPKHITKTENNAFTLTAAGAVIVFHKQIQPAEKPATTLRDC
jgi:hypothetical protein